MAIRRRSGSIGNSGLSKPVVSRADGTDRNFGITAFMGHPLHVAGTGIAAVTDAVLLVPMPFEHEG
jgi:hypothetical protein